MLAEIYTLLYDDPASHNKNGKPGILYSVYEQNIKSESRKANYNAKQCIVMDIVDKFMYKKRNIGGDLVKSAHKG